jgi:hypothetical protein
LREVFMDNRIAVPPSLHLLERAAAAGHQLVAYMLGLCLYRPNSGTDDDDKAFRLIRKFEGDDEEDVAAVPQGMEEEDRGSGRTGNAGGPGIRSGGTGASCFQRWSSSSRKVWIVIQ